MGQSPNELHSFERNENKCMCVGVDSPIGGKTQILLRLDMITGGESPSKMSEWCVASCSEIPKIRGPQIHVHTKI